MDRSGKAGSLFFARATQKAVLEMKYTPQREPISDILARVSAELAGFAGSVEELHCLVEKLDASSSANRKELLHSAQSIDIVEQGLSDLARFVSELSALTPAHWSVEGQQAARNLKLAALAQRLLSSEPQSAHCAQHSAGEFDLF
jgi:hypothetical protein